MKTGPLSLAIYLLEALQPCLSLGGYRLVRNKLHTKSSIDK